MTNGDISFKLLKPIGIISELPTGWNKELNIVSWNGGEPKYDIRDWSQDHTRMSRGMTFRKEDMKGLLDIMKERNLDIDFPVKEEKKREEPEEMER